VLIELFSPVVTAWRYEHFLRRLVSFGQIFT